MPHHEAQRKEMMYSECEYLSAGERASVTEQKASFETSTPKTSYTVTKRKETFETPAAKSARSIRNNSPGGGGITSASNGTT